MRWDPVLLAKKFGIVLPDAPPDGGTTKGKTTKGKTTPTTTRPRPDDADDEPVPFDLDAYPSVREALDYVSDPPDRSNDTYRVVAAVYHAGLTLPNARWAVEQRPDLAERIDGRSDDDVAVSWCKIDAEAPTTVGDDGDETGFADEYIDPADLPDDFGKKTGENGGDGANGDNDSGSDGGPEADAGTGWFTDARLAEHVADRVLRKRLIHVRGIGWLRWTGQVWEDCGDGPPTEAVRRFVVGRISYWAGKLAKNPTDSRTAGMLNEWRKVGSRFRITALVALAGNIAGIEIAAALLDADRDLVNTPGGIVDLRTGAISPHDAAKLMTMITRGSYRPGYTHPDVEMALTAIDEPERTLLLNRVGQGITGHQTPDDVIPLLQGLGSNGKTGLFGHAMLNAFGDYGHTASAKLFAATEKGSEHSTEMADLRGRRFVLGEEMQEGARLNITVLKRITTAKITARFCRQDNLTFDCTHSLFLTSNPVPIVVETDDGTWRRMARFLFKYRYVATEADVERPTDRVGDPELRRRLREGETGQHDAMVTLAVGGAMRWYADPQHALLPTERVKADTLEWRIDADRILGYWNEHLVADKTGKILKAEMFEDFNRWMTENGHNPWAAETFGPKFANHAETRRHGVEGEKARNLDGLSRPRRAGFGMTTPKRPWVWIGVRFRTDADDAADDLRRTPGGNASEGGGEQAASR